MAKKEMNPDFTSGLFSQTDDLPWSGIEGLRSACLEMVLIDIQDPLPAGDHLFTPRERARALRMGSRRRRGFTAARVALKMLARRLGLVEKGSPECTIETLGPDGVRPCLAESDIYCSASHSDRFVAAVAHRHPVGVDLETVSEKVMRIRHLFLKSTEWNLLSLSPLGPERTAIRLWTVKEAAAKVLRLHLFDSFREVEVVSVGEKEGALRFRGKAYLVKHAEGNGQVITLVNGDAL